MYEPQFLGQITAPPELKVNFLGHVAEPCLRCKRDMVTAEDWSALSRSDRKAIKKDFAPFCSRGLCRSCYNHLHRDHPDELADYERQYMAGDIFAEEYNTFKQSGMTDDHIAKKLGMYLPSGRTPYHRMSTFYKALERARERGLISE